MAPTVLSGRRKQAVSATAVLALTGALGLTAALYQGTPVTDVDLNDGGVWVTNPVLNLVGHLNFASRILDGAVRTLSGDFDVEQRAETVLVADTGSATISALDPATVTFSDEATLPPDGELFLGGETAAVLADAGRTLWVLPASQITSFHPTSTAPMVSFSESASVAVGNDGVVYAVGDGNLATISVGATPPTEETEGTGIEVAEIEGLSDGEAAITVVGDEPVVLDRGQGALFLADGTSVALPGGETAELQQPGAASDVVALATTTDLLLQPLDGEGATSVAAGASGEPVAPVQLNGCTYAAWSASAKYLRDCEGTENDRAQDIPEGAAAGQLTFRVNRDIVVLNSLSTGTVWLTDDALTKIDNWQEITPQAAEDEELDDSVESTSELAAAERDEENNPPDAVDDLDFGVRPGRTTVLRVLENDSDPDGDVLVARPTGPPSQGQVDVVLDGAALQITLPPEAAGTSTFGYEADDGRGGVDSAQVSVAVHDWSVNAEPTQLRTLATTVESGQSVTLHVLGDWIDPDGDDLFLASATPMSEDEVRFTADGTVTFSDVGTSVGRKTVAIVVSDGTLTTEGEIVIEVRPPGQLPPVAVPDHVTALVGEEATVAPLDNDTDPNGDLLRLADVPDVEGVAMTADFAAGTLTLSAAAAGTYYIVYNASDGPSSAPGVVRFDAVEPAAENLAPVAVRDTALLPVGGEVYVDPLGNDVDPSGGVLVVQSVTVPPDSGLQAAVVNNHLLRVSAAKALDGPVSFEYTAANGFGTATGQVTVISVPRPATLQPPTAADDEVVVRVGDVVDIDVLDNDSHPNGDPIEVVKDLAQEPEIGLAFTAEDLVRYKAPDQPGQAYLVYSVTDTAGQIDSAQVTIQIRESDPERNSPPNPRNIEARVLAGAEVRVDVPLAELDPDGDSVSLVGLTSAPTKGTVTEIGRNYFVYEAAPNSSGTDSFSYEVTDRLGATASATVRIGVAARSDINRDPLAVEDIAYARPDRAVAIDVLANDLDPDGDPITLEPGTIEVVAGEVPAEVTDGFVELRTPESEATLTYFYGISDGRSGTATGSLTVEVDQEAPLLPPIARDDVIRAEDLAEDATSVRIPVLDNDADPDGRRADLEVSFAEGEVDGNDLVVTITEVDQVLPYTVTDVDGLTGSAFVWVPGVSEEERTGPVGTGSVEVVSGEEIQIPVADHVIVEEGRTPVLTDRDSVSAVNSDGSSLVVDETTLRYVSAEGYSGQASITFRVTDGTGADDPDGLAALITIPITVLPAPDEQHPPTFTTGTLRVSPGEDASSLNLRALTADPDEGDLEAMTYRVTSPPSGGVTASVEGQSLIASAPATADKGVVTEVGIEISDGSSDPVPGVVVVEVVGSTRPLPTVNDEVVDQARQGETVSVPVLANDVSPFPGEPLSLVGGAVVETGNGTARISGDSIDVTPAGDFVGTMVVRYRVGDVTGDPEREVDGRIRVTVQGRPGAPSTPQVVEVRSKTVVLSWSPPANNGAEITGYTVTGGGVTRQCPTTTCTIDGLTNDVEYTFTVTATNAVGTSEPSPASASARPDQRPSAPNAPTVTFGDGQLEVAWAAPTGYEGSAVESYTLEISPAAGSSQVEVTGTSYTWSGLTNGQQYQFRVQAHNKADSPSDWSGYGSETPAGVPIITAAPSVERLEPVGSQAQLRVTWPVADDNGAALSGSSLQVVRGGSVVNTLSLGGDVTSQVINLDTSETAYTFQVSATNRAGTSDYGPASSPMRAVVAPGAPSGVSASPGDNAVTVTYGAAAGNGASASEISYEYQINGGSWQSMPGGGTITSGISNNNSYTVGVRAVTNVDGQTYTGPAATSSQVAPYGPPRQSSISQATNGQRVRFTWTDPGRNGRDYRVQAQENNGSWFDVAKSGSRDVGSGYSQTHKLCVRTVDVEGQTSSPKCATGKTVNAPPKVTVSVGAQEGVQGTDTANYVLVRYENFTPKNNVSFSCSVEGGGYIDGATFTVNINASGNLDRYYWYGFGGNVYCVVDGVRSASVGGWL